MNGLENRTMGMHFPNGISVRARLAVGFTAVVGLGASLLLVASCTAEDGIRSHTHEDAAGGGGFGRGELDPGGLCAPGMTAECHVTVGTENDVLTCLNGRRTCVDGKWGPCVGGFSARVGWDGATAANANPGEVRPFNLSDAGPCVNNPCDPYCQVFPEEPPADGGYEVIPTVETVYYTGSLEDALALNPPGFVGKGMKTPCGKTEDCQFDSDCVPTGTHGETCPGNAPKCCMAWESPEFDKECPKPDVTTGFACTKDGLPTIPVCNRGSVELPKNTKVYVFPGNAPQFPACDPNDKPKSECYTDAPIPPGTCININNCNPQFGGNGTRTIFVNPPKVSMTGGKNNAQWQDECTCKNNWGVWSGEYALCYEKPNYTATPVVKTQVYQAVCPSDSQVQWGYLSWNTTTPLDSSVIWKGRVASTSAGLASASHVLLGTAKAIPAPDTQICSPAGPAPCPINVFAALGGAPAARSEFLEIEITILPSTDQSKGAQVNGWEITYSCPPSQ